jgi:hypothetical protein
MRLVDLILSDKLSEAKELVRERLDQIKEQKLEEMKRYVAEDTYIEEDIIDEAKSTNVIRMGRIKKIRRRIRRNAKGKIVVQRNRRKSAVKGYRISGSGLKRITAVQRIQKSRKLKRYWKSKGRATLTRRKLKQKMSMRRRKSMGIR